MTRPDNEPASSTDLLALYERYLRFHVAARSHLQAEPDLLVERLEAEAGRSVEAYRAQRAAELHQVWETKSYDDFVAWWRSLSAELRETLALQYERGLDGVLHATKSAVGAVLDSHTVTPLNTQEC